MKKVPRLLTAALVFGALFIGTMSAFGQSGAEIDKLLGTDEVSFALAARFVLPAADALPATATAEAAFGAAIEKGWLPADAASDDPVTLSTLSFLVMQAFGMKGGAMYSLSPGPRYAYRELLYLKVIQGTSDPALTVSGERLMRILGRVLDMKGDAS